MPTRLAEYSDIPQMSKVLAASFGPDKLFQVMFPHQIAYESDFVDAFQTRLTENWWDYTRVQMVSYTAVPSASMEVITGVAEWQLVGLGCERVWNTWGWWDPRKYLFFKSSPFHESRERLHRSCCLQDRSTLGRKH